LHGEACMGTGHLGAGQHRHDTVMLGGHLCHSIAKRVGPQVGASIFFPELNFLPLYLTTHLWVLNVTVHPTSVNTQILNKEAIERLGMMWPVNVTGRPGVLMMHICVVQTCRPSANVTMSGQVVRFLFLTGVPSMTKIWVALELAMASPVGDSIAARAMAG
jgi:hypothetical protein